MSLDEQLWDVLVLGGGVAGVAAAVEAAGAGRRTLLVERRPTLGWEVAWAHAPYLTNGSGRLFDRLTGALNRPASIGVGLAIK